MESTGYKILKESTFHERYLKMSKDNYFCQCVEDDETEVWYDPYKINCMLCKSWCYSVPKSESDLIDRFKCCRCGFIVEIDFCKNKEFIGRKIVLKYSEN